MAPLLLPSVDANQLILHIACFGYGILNSPRLSAKISVERAKHNAGVTIGSLIVEPQEMTAVVR
jgi:hypothetical protein